MIIRIVKMIFREDSSEIFKEFTTSIQDTIKSFEGCIHLDIFRDIHLLNIFFSYSHWESEDYLNNYRNSEFFKTTWAKTKLWFEAKPDAWSVQNLENRN